jgi:hypothetical protein
MALEVVWPRHKWDYLTVPDPDMPVNPPPLPSTWADHPHRLSATLEIGESNGEGVSRTVRARSRVPQTRQRVPVVADERTSLSDHARSMRRSHASLDTTHQQGRILAAHAFLHGAHCRERRVGELLGVSRRTVGRDRAQRLQTAPPIRERAQALIAASADCGSTPGERAVAMAFVASCSTLPAVEAGGPGAETPGPPLPDLSSGPSERATSQCSGSPPPVEVPMSADLSAPDRQPHTTLTLAQVDALHRLHRPAVSSRRPRARRRAAPGALRPAPASERPPTIRGRRSADTAPRTASRQCVGASRPASRTAKHGPVHDEHDGRRSRRPVRLWRKRAVVGH